MNTNLNAHYDENSQRLLFDGIKDTPGSKQKAGIHCYNNKLTQTVMKFFGIAAEVSYTTQSGQHETRVVKKDSFLKFIDRNKDQPASKELRQQVLSTFGKTQDKQLVAFEQQLENRKIDIPKDLYNNSIRLMNSLSGVEVETLFNAEPRNISNPTWRSQTGQRELFIAALFHPNIGGNSDLYGKFQKLPLSEQVQILAVLEKRKPEYATTPENGQLIKDLREQFVYNIMNRADENEAEVTNAFLDALAFLQQDKELSHLQKDIIEDLADKKHLFKKHQKFHDTFVESQVLLSKK